MVGRQSYLVWSCGGLIVTDERTLLWTSSFSVTNLAILLSLPVFGCLSIVIRILESSKGCLRPTGLGRTIMSLCAAIIGRGFHRRILGILSKSVDHGELPHHLVCVFPLIFLSSFVVST